MYSPAQEEASPDSSQLRKIIIFNAGHLSSAIGYWAQKTAIGWLAWDLTHSVAWVGIVVSADLVSSLWVAPLAGALADRSNPFKSLLVTHMALLLCALALMTISMSGHLSAVLLFLFVLVESTLSGFNQPNKILVLSLIAPPGRLSQFIATSSISMAVARCVGPAMAGLLIHLGSVNMVFVLHAASIVCMMVSLSVLKASARHEPLIRRGSFLSDITGGFSYVLESRRIRTVMLLAFAFALLGRPFSELFPAISGTLYSGGADVIATLMTAQGAGALAGGLLMLRSLNGNALLTSVLVSGMGLVLSVMAFVNASSLTFAMFMVAIAGFFHVICNIAMQSLCQLSAEPRMRGRVASLYGIIFRSAPALGAFVITQLSHWLELGLDVLISAGVVVYGLVLLLAASARRRIFS